MIKGGQLPVPIESDLSASFNSIDHTLLLTSFTGSEWERRGVRWAWGTAPASKSLRLLLRSTMVELGKGDQPKQRR